MARHKKLIPLLSLCLFQFTKADVPWVPYYDETFLITNEYLIDYENGFSNKLSGLGWGGVALIFTSNKNARYNYGYEYAYELRYYLLDKELTGFFSSAYIGYGKMKTPEEYRGDRKSVV